MTIAVAALAGLSYAAALWWIAQHVARGRGLTLGAFPAWTALLCLALAAVAADCLSLRDAVLTGSTLVGTIVCALVDARTGLIFDALSLTMLAVAAIAGMYAGRLADGAAGAVVVGAALGALYLVTGRRGIGLGDVKLGSAIGLGYGVASACLAIGGAFVLGASYAVVMLLNGRAKSGDAVRFGPFLAAGTVVALTAGITGWWP